MMIASLHSAFEKSHSLLVVFKFNFHRLRNYQSKLIFEAD